MAIANLVRRTMLVFGVLAIGAAIALGQRRTWRDDTGRFSVEAELVESKQDNVLLKRTDGTTITVPVARLSAADRDHLKTLAKPEAKSSGSDVLRPKLAFPDAMTAPPSWNDANTPFDLAAFLKAPPPEENAAPLYLDALYQFEPGDMASILYPNMPWEVLAKHDPHFASARYEKQMQLDEAWQKDPKSVDTAAVDSWLAHYDKGFDKLAAAQQRPKCMFQPGRSLHSLWSHVQASRQVLRVVQWRTRRDVQRGDLERPLRDLKMVLRLTRDLQVRGGMVAVLVGSALDEQSCELVRTMLNAPGITVGHCDWLLALLVEHEAKSIDMFVEGNRGEYITSRQALHDMQHRTGTFDPKYLKDGWGMQGDVNSPLACIRLFTDIGGPSSQRLTAGTVRLMSAMLPGALQGGKVLSEADYAKEVTAMNAYFASILKLAEQPGFLLRGEDGIKAAEATTNETALAWLVIPPSSNLLETIRRGKARIRGTECLAALRRWQLEHQEAPPSLDALVKAAGMAQVPLDPYSDKPLLLGSIAGKPVFYSVAADGKDDKAQVEWKLAPNQPGDLIFQLDVSAQ